MTSITNQKYSDIISLVVGHGLELDSRIGKTSELLGMQSLFPPNVLFNRKGFSPRFAWVDAMQALGGYFNPAELEAALGHKIRIPYNKASAWGQYVELAFPSVFRQLVNNPETRRAVITFGFDQIGETEKPCVVSMQFLIREGALHMIVYMRSWDLGVGLLYDLAVFQLMLQTLAGLLSLSAGPIMVMAGSAHVYHKDLPRFGAMSYLDEFNSYGKTESIKVEFLELAELPVFEYRLAEDYLSFLWSIRNEYDWRIADGQNEKTAAYNLYRQIASLLTTVSAVFANHPTKRPYPTIIEESYNHIGELQ